jgi:hypothetical protein
MRRSDRACWGGFGAPNKPLQKGPLILLHVNAIVDAIYTDENTTKAVDILKVNKFIVEKSGRKKNDMTTFKRHSNHNVGRETRDPLSEVRNFGYPLPVNWNKDEQNAVDVCEYFKCKSCIKMLHESFLYS